MSGDDTEPTQTTEADTSSPQGGTEKATTNKRRDSSQSEAKQRAIQALSQSSSSRQQHSDDGEGGTASKAKRRTIKTKTTRKSYTTNDAATSRKHSTKSRVTAKRSRNSSSRRTTKGNKMDEKASSVLPTSPQSTTKATKGSRAKKRPATIPGIEFPDQSSDWHWPDKTTSSTSNSETAYASLLPPPLTDSSGQDSDDDDSIMSSGLSSWEQFLGMGNTARNDDSSVSFLDNPSQPTSATSYSQKERSTSKSEKNQHHQSLPSIQDLFPPDLSSVASLQGTDNSMSTGNLAQQPPPPQKTLEGVLPVSDLFYRSPSPSPMQDTKESSDDAEKSAFMDDDSEHAGVDQGSSSNNNNNNNERGSTKKKTKAANDKSASSATSKTAPAGKSSTEGRRMVRRGMDMVVGGVPVFADPPKRSVELFYNPQNNDWASALTLSSDLFGKFWDNAQAAACTDLERQSFCESFVHSALKWDVCPKDLRSIVKKHTLEQEEEEQSNDPYTPEEIEQKFVEYGFAQPGNEFISSGDSDTLDPDEFEAWLLSDDKKDLEEIGRMLDAFGVIEKQLFDGWHRMSKEVVLSYSSFAGKIYLDPEAAALVYHALGRNGFLEEYGENMAVFLSDEARAKLRKDGLLPPAAGLTTDDDAAPKSKGFGKPGAKKKASKSSSRQIYQLSSMFQFELAVAKEDLEANEADGDEEMTVLRSVLAQTCEMTLIQTIEGTDFPKSFSVDIQSLNLVESDDGFTRIETHFLWHPNFPVTEAQRDRMSHAFINLLSDGNSMVLCLAKVIKNETRWPAQFRAQLIEECLMQDDDVLEEQPGQFASEPRLDMSTKARNSLLLDIKDKLLSEQVQSNENGLFLPYGGEIGLRLVDAVVEKAKERHPRVIAVGDVHGCIDELQDLLRECDYRPGDLVVFLGDLVCKGPDSISVVQMAREIGAIGVRGNHDFEVIRWHQAIKSGVDPPVVGSEHFHIASCLKQADIAWMCNLPWYINSKELSTLFVHAGFVSGIRLAKQNPRLMMNMRSILPDGTVTSKFFNNWPWARLWDGPQTVLFGHDADRGLQQYEHAIGLDTGCVYGGRLTAIILPEKRLVSVSAKRKYFKYRRKHYD